MKSKILYLALLIFAKCLAASPLLAQQRPFPAWMNDVSFETNNSHIEIPQINRPCQKAPNQQPAAHKQTKPNLPDFSKMRLLASKAKEQKIKALQNRLEDSYKACIKAEPTLKKRRSQYESLLAISKSKKEAETIKNELESLNKKISLNAEFIALFTADGAKKAAAELSAAEFERAVKISEALFGELKHTIKAPSKPQAKPLNENSTEDEIENERLRLKTYRPGRIKSFYSEQKNKGRNAQNQR